MAVLAFFQNMGPGEWIIIFAILLLLFGATRIPQLARSLGKSMGEFKKGVREGAEDGKAEDKDESKSPKA